MDQKDDRGRTKGTFGSVGFEITKKHIFPASRRKMIVGGSIASLVLILIFLMGTFFLNDRFASPGPVSSKHANFESNCSKCHGVSSKTNKTNETTKQCKVCHEKTGDNPGVYTYSAHYLYNTKDVLRIAASQKKHGKIEAPCSVCHAEHQGRKAIITRVDDNNCVDCHRYGSFNKKHPEFEFAKKKIKDDASLKFTHIKHTKLVMEKIQKETGSLYTEKACFYCHQPNPDGKEFQPIQFEPHCGKGCHLTASSKTPSLAIFNPSSPAPGVWTLEMMKEGPSMGTGWLASSNPNEFKPKPIDKILKSPVRHSDPWILENLKRNRQAVYPHSDLVDLIKAAPLKNGSDRAYKEAIATLKGYVANLRGNPGIEADLDQLDAALATAALQTPDLIFAKAQVSILAPAEKQAYEEFALRLAEPCMECHAIENMQIQGVRAKQQVLHRALFDHRSHITERRCLECHTEIPIAQALEGTLKEKEITEKNLDHAGIQNIPTMENCMACHKPSAAANACVACHDMHPNKTQRGNLQLFVDKR